MDNNKKNAKVGLFMIIGVLIFAAGLVLLGNMRKVFISKIGVKAVFTDVSGLTKGNNVFFSGVKVGTVESMEFLPTTGVMVHFNIEQKSVPFIFKDSKVKVTTDGLIGNPILVISGGAFKNGKVEENHQFIVENEQSQQDMIKTLQESNKNILEITSGIKSLVGSIQAGEGTLGKLVKDENLYKNLNATMIDLKTTSAEASSFAKNMNTFSNSFNDKNNLPYQLVHNTSMLPALQHTFQNFETSSKDLQNTVNEGKLLIRDVKLDINRITSNKNSALGILTNNQEVAENLKSVINNVDSGTKKLDQNLEAMQHNILFRRYFRKKAKEDQKQSDAKQSEEKE